MIVTTRFTMSKVVGTFLQQNPLILKYMQMGLINITSLAKHIKESDTAFFSKATTTAISMAVRRHVASAPKVDSRQATNWDKNLQFVVRSNLTELIFVKSDEKRQVGLQLFHKISKTKHFSCLVEGEKEIVLLTDFPVDKLLESKGVINSITHQTEGLAFISIDLPIELREIVGVYSTITTQLALADISIHSFHTIGGEILILVRDEDLVDAQRVLSGQTL